MFLKQQKPLPEFIRHILTRGMEVRLRFLVMCCPACLCRLCVSLIQLRVLSLIPVFLHLLGTGFFVSLTQAGSFSVSSGGKGKRRCLGVCFLLGWEGFVFRSVGWVYFCPFLLQHRLFPSLEGLASTAA